MKNYSAKPMRPLITYYGGKQRIAHHIIDKLPPHLCYTEPFCGGAAVMFKKGRPNLGSYTESINDINELVVQMYRVCAQPDKFKQVYDELLSTPYSRSEHKRASNILNNSKDHDEIKIAWALIIASAQGFGHSFGKGWGFAKIRTVNKSSVNLQFNYDNYKRQLKRYYRRLSQIFIDNLDALRFIKNWDSASVCQYCDPPYIGTEQGTYKGYRQEDFNELLYTIKHSKSSFVLSTYANDELKLYNWPYYKVKAKMSINNKSKKSHDRAELIYVIDRSKDIAQKERRHCWSPNQLSAQMNLF